MPHAVYACVLLLKFNAVNPQEMWQLGLTNQLKTNPIYKLELKCCFFRLRDLPEKQVTTPNKLETVVERVMRLREQQKLGENSNENRESPSRKSEKVNVG